MMKEEKDPVGAEDNNVVTPDSAWQQEQQHHIILFYKYHPLSADWTVMQVYRTSLEKLCLSLSLIGRILIGCSKTEGLNGTLAGSYDDVRAFTIALLGADSADDLRGCVPSVQQAVQRFWKESRSFFASIGEPELTFESPGDFKWSTVSVAANNDELFPDLRIKLVSELISTGGVFSSIPLGETAQGYLSPREWHDKLQKLTKNGSKSEEGEEKDVVLIDCRNSKEYEIGRFETAIDPKTTTFSQFPKWVQDHEHLLANKKVMMYCTGGIRCEKVRRKMGESKWSIRFSSSTR
jgi:predicted sulfurtransferase